jgi:hypothetical protein
MKPRVVKVSPSRLRELFNSGDYSDRISAGKLVPKVLREGHPAPPKSHEPPCTKSQILAYLDARGHRVVIVHQYLRTNGKLGASGRPDPKKLYEAGVLYVAR